MALTVPAEHCGIDESVRSFLPGTTIYEGFAVSQGGLLGEGNQVYIRTVNPNWLVHQ